jgi:hypothetical protein
MIDTIAWLYVNFLEPAGKFLLVVIGVLVILSIINFIRDPKAKENMVSALLGLLFKVLKGIIVYSGIVLQKGFGMLLKSLMVIYAAIRDFIGSKI